MQFYTKVVGVTYENRQSIISNLYRAGKLSPDTKLVLRREANNPFDVFAVAVLTEDGQQLGYISKEQARDMSLGMHMGIVYQAYVATVTGGNDGWSYGINLRIECNQILNVSAIVNEDKEIVTEGTISFLDISVGTQLTHKKFGLCEVISVGNNMMKARFDDDTERTFLLDCTPKFFEGVFGPPNAVADKSIVSQKQNGVIQKEKADYVYKLQDHDDRYSEHEYDYDNEDMGPSEESYEYYFGDDEPY